MRLCKNLDMFLTWKLDTFSFYHSAEPSRHFCDGKTLKWKEKMKIATNTRRVVCHSKHRYKVVYLQNGLALEVIIQCSRRFFDIKRITELLGILDCTNVNRGAYFRLEK